MPATLFAAAVALLPWAAPPAGPTGLIREFIGVGDTLRSVAFSRDGKFVAAGSGVAAVLAWDVASGKRILLLEGAASPVFAHDGKTLLTIRPNGAEVDVWGFPDGKKRRTLPGNPNGKGTHLALSPDGETVASAGDTVRLWRAATGESLGDCWGMGGKTPASRLAFFPDGKRLAASFGRGESLGVASAKKFGRRWWLEAHMAFPSASCLVVSPEGAAILFGGRDGSVRSWGRDWIKARVDRLWESRRGGISSLAVSPDGRCLAVSTREGFTQVWELRTRGLRREYKSDSGETQAVSFSPDGKKLASAGDDGVLRVWDLSRVASRTPPDGGSLERSWAALGESDAAPASEAIWTLAAHPKQSIPFLALKLAGETTPEADRLARLAIHLDDDDFEVRERTARELAKAGPAARPALVAALEKPLSPEQKNRASKLLALLPAPLPGKGGADLRDARVAELLERLGVPNDPRLLETLAGSDQ